MEIVGAINAKLSDLKARYEEIYGLALFDVTARESGNALLLSGSVLVEKQRDEAVSIAKEAFGGRVKSNIEIIGRKDFKPLNGWAAAKEIANIWRYLPGSKAAEALKSEKANLSSQLDAWDYPAKVIRKAGEYLLLLLVDGTIGWAKSGELVKFAFDGNDFWHDVNRALVGRRVGVAEGVERLIEAAERYVGVPYLWGGASSQGIDCSGLVQRAYYEGVGLILPKNSRQQLKMGERVLKKEITAGDIVFFTVEESILHVGLLLDDDRLIHASRDERKVIAENAATAMKKRRFAGARRLAVFESAEFLLQEDGDKNETTALFEPRIDS